MAHAHGESLQLWLQSHLFTGDLPCPVVRPALAGQICPSDGIERTGARGSRARHAHRWEQKENRAPKGCDGARQGLPAASSFRRRRDHAISPIRFNVSAWSFSLTVFQIGEILFPGFADPSQRRPSN